MVHQLGTGCRDACFCHGNGFNFNFLNIWFLLLPCNPGDNCLPLCLSICNFAEKKTISSFFFFFNHILHMKLTSWKLLAHTMSLLLQDKMCHCSICYSFADESVRQHAAEQNIPKKKKLCSPTDLALTELGPGLINHFAALLTVPGKTLGLPLGSNISGAC